MNNVKDASLRGAKRRGNPARALWARYIYCAADRVAAGLPRRLLAARNDGYGRWSIGSFLLIITIASTSFAQGVDLGKRDTNQPIDISSNSLEVVQDQKIAIFKGKVVAIQGTMRLQADRMTVHYRPAKEKKSTENGIQSIDVDGNVFITTPEETAQGDKGVYDVDAKKITLTSNVVLTKEKNVLKGSALEYNLATGKSVVTSGTGNSATGGRVRALFVPENNKK